MNVLVQGMRRSGTTILYDALLEDPQMRCFYEPLREDEVSVGGGSGARGSDAFAETRALREEFRRVRFPELDPDDFNWGGPRAPELELEPALPEHCRELLRHLLDLDVHVTIKETRLHCKLAEVAALAPEAVLVHVVRDPRAVATSMVLGRNHRRLAQLGGADGAFADRAPRKLWSSREISERLLAKEGAPQLDDPSNVERVLLVWELAFERTRRDGLELFGERYLMLRNEDLRADPRGSLAKLYTQLGREVPAQVSAWAVANVREPHPPFAAEDPRWQEAINRVGAEVAVAAAGYADAAGTGARLDE